MPGIVSTVDVDAEGHMVQTRTPMMGLEMVLTRSSRQVALGEHGAPELLLQTFIRPNRPIERARELQRGVYALSLPEGSMPGLPSFGDQITAAEDGRVIVTVELGSSPKLDSDRLDTAPYLRSSLYANLEDPALVALRQKATQDVAPEPALRAEALRAFANSYLDQKDLGSLFATASEVVVNRSGDCTEHAVLLMALLRSEGIPARVVTGLVYADSFAGAADIFGYHMWTQALLEGRWIDLDATLQKRYDATHIAFAATPLNREGDATKDLAQVMQLAGELKVEILQTGYKAEAE
jgi:transglutaminase-like putative cysteine protease